MTLFAEEKTLVADEGATSTGPEIVVFAAFNHPPKYPVRVSALAEMVCRSRTPTYCDVYYTDSRYTDEVIRPIVVVIHLPLQMHNVQYHFNSCLAMSFELYTFHVIHSISTLRSKMNTYKIFLT